MSEQKRKALLNMANESDMTDLCQKCSNFQPYKFNEQMGKCLFDDRRRAFFGADEKLVLHHYNERKVVACNQFKELNIADITRPIEPQI